MIFIKIWLWTEDKHDQTIAAKLASLLQLWRVLHKLRRNIDDHTVGGIRTNDIVTILEPWFCSTSSEYQHFMCWQAINKRAANLYIILNKELKIYGKLYYECKKIIPKWLAGEAYEKWKLCLHIHTHRNR